MPPVIGESLANFLVGFFLASRMPGVTSTTAIGEIRGRVPLSLRFSSPIRDLLFERLLFKLPTPRNPFMLLVIAAFTARLHWSQERLRESSISVLVHLYLHR